MHSLAVPSLSTLALSVALAAVASADSYTLTLLTEPGAGITASQEWSRRLAHAGIANVRIRGARHGERPDIQASDLNGGTHYRVIGVLAGGDALLLPGAKFSARDTAQLEDYLQQVVAEGAASVTASRGAYGLTKQQFEDCFAVLSQPLATDTEGKPLTAIINSVSRTSGLAVRVPDGLRTTVARLQCQDNLRPLSIGTALAIGLKEHGLAFAPQKPRGAPVELEVGYLKSIDPSWPIGYQPKAPVSQLAPVLLKKINVEIDGFTLAEAVGAIAPRIEAPVLWDHAALDASRIDPDQVQVTLPRANLYYSRILDKLLFQAHLRGQLRTDEAGVVFYWISR